MSYSDNFPATRPVFMADFANGGKIDPRATFTRSDTPPTYAAPSAVHYWSNEKHLSSENRVTNSNDLSDWGRVDITRTLGQVGPDGASTAAKLTGQAGTVFKAILNATLANTSAQTISFFAKEDTHRYIQVSVNGDATKFVNFDLNGSGAYSANGSGVTASITASANGYLRCAVNLTLPNTAAYISLQDSLSAAREATTASTGSIYIFGAMATTLGDATNVAAYVSTGSQIHREYAPSLKSVTTAGQPRFEYDPATDGQSMGILIEGQATNLNPYSDALASWTTSSDVTLTSNASLGPDGTLGADLMVANTNNTGHYVRSSGITVSASTSYTLSGYFKSVNGEKVRLSFFRGSSPYTGEASVKFTLSGSGSVSASTGSGTITSVGNGWYRCTATGTALTTNSLIQVSTVSTGDAQDYAGNAYNGVLCAGIQFESGSHCSSLISTSGSTATRASDNLSVATADITGFSEGVGTVVYETGGVASATETNQLGFGLRADSANFFTAGVNNGGVTDASVRVYSKTSDGDQSFLNPGTATVGTGYKLACRFELDNIAASMNGGTVVSDTSGQVPVGVDTLWVGQLAGDYYLNSNLKRIAIYNEALSDTNLQALTS